MAQYISGRLTSDFCGDPAATRMRVRIATTPARQGTQPLLKRMPQGLCPMEGEWRSPAGPLPSVRGHSDMVFSTFQSGIFTYAEGMASSFLSGLACTRRTRPYPTSQSAVSEDIQGKGPQSLEPGPCELNSQASSSTS